MSSRLLHFRDKANDIADDLESTFWVLVYCALKHFPVPFGDFPSDLFDPTTVDLKDILTGGHSKFTYIKYSLLKRFLLSSAPLYKLINHMSLTWSAFNAIYSKDSLYDRMVKA